jgi:hypothetical protein
MLAGDELIEIWFEKHDDIVLVWRNNHGILIEFVQVKHENKASRWSAHSLTERDKSKKGNGLGTSLLEKSLNNSRCAEETVFRIVTSYDVDSDLEVLKLQRNDPRRAKSKSVLAALGKKFLSKLGDIKSEDGTTITQWTERCYWDKRPDTVSSIRAENLLRLEEIARAKKRHVSSDHRDEIYQSLLALVSYASSVDLDAHPRAEKITKADLEEWWLQKATMFATPAPHTQKMILKMEAAQIPPETISDAQELRRMYLSKRLNRDYISAPIYEDVEAEVTAVLNSARSKLDSGDVTDTGMQFHSRCLERLKELSHKPLFVKYGITEPYLQGNMYDRTNRCVHRFLRAQP